MICEFFNIIICREILSDRIIFNKNVYIFFESSWFDFDLFVGGDGIEDDFCKVLGGKYFEIDVFYYFVVFY